MTQTIAVGMVIGMLFITSALLALTAGPTLCWHPANTGLTNPDVETLAAAPVSPTILCASIWGDVVFRSMDNGASLIAASNGITLPFYVSGAPAVTVGPPANGSSDLDRVTLYAGDYYNGGVVRMVVSTRR